MKKVLLVSQSQDGSFINILYSALKNADCELHVITGKTGGIDENVFVTQMPKYDSTSLKSRFLTWTAFVRAAKKYMKNNIDRFDAVMFTSNPPVNQTLVNYANKKGKKTVYLVWDIYPQIVERVLGNAVKPIVEIWKRINRKMYAGCDKVLTIGEIMKKNIKNTYPNLDVDVISFHTNTEFIHPIDNNENSFAKKHGLTDKTVIMYSGKMGLGHGFDTILKLAKNLENESKIKFVFIGFGSELENIKKFIKDNDLKNVLLLPYQPIEILPLTLGSADVSLITVKTGTEGLFLPSKIYDAMASGSAILCLSSDKNDASEIVEKHKIGCVCRADDYEQLKKAVLKFADESEFLKECQKNARELAVNEYDISIITGKYEEMFRELLEG